MKGVLFIPTVPDTAWARVLLPDLSPAELPVAGLRIIDYDIEYATKQGAEMIEVLDWSYSKRIEKDFSDLTAYPIPVFYLRGEGDLPKGLNDLMTKRSTPLTQNLDDGITVIWGMSISDTISHGETLEPISDEDCEHTPMGLYRRVNGKWMRMKHHGLLLRGIREWHRVSRAILENPSHFTLPGYSAEAGIHLGRNVVMEHGVEIKGPVLLQDNTWLSRNVRIDGDVIVGKGSFISEGAHLSRTVIGDDTYIGIGLELEDKIVIGRRVIDVNTGMYTDIEEPGIARGIGGGKGLWRRIVDFFYGNSRGRSH